MDRIQEMQFFIATANAGSFSAAARETGASLSSIWRHVNALEDRIGTPLLKRTNKEIVLTDSGKLFLDHAQEIVRSVAAMDEVLGGSPSEPHGKILLHTNVAFGQRFISPALPDFLEKYPQVTVNLWATDNSPDIVENGIDLAIRVGTLADTSALIARRLGAITFHVCATPDYLARHAEVSTPTDLEQHPCLSYRLGSNPPIWHLEGPEGTHDVKVHNRLQSSIADPLRAAALRGMGIALLPARLVREDLVSGRLKAILPQYAASIRGSEAAVYLVWRKERHMPAKLRVMIDFIVDVFRDFENLQAT